MANYSTDFSEYSTGSIPSDWTARWDTTTEFTVETGGADRILKAAISTPNRYVCTWNDVDADADRANAEVLIKFRVLSVSSGEFHGGAAIRASGTGTTETGYLASIIGDDLVVAKYVSGTYTLIVTQALTLLANTDYWLRLRINGSALQAKIWLATDSEPGPWGIDTTDTSISAAGWAGVYARSAAGDPEFDAIAIATNGDTASFAGGGTSITLNQTTETDTAQPVGKAKYKAIGQPSTTDTAQAIIAARRVAVGQVSETDSAQAVTSGKILTLGQSTETDAAQAVTEAGSITAAVGQVAETDLAQAVASSKLKTIGQISETDSAQAVVVRKAKAIGQATETDSVQAFAVSKTVAVGQVTETEFAQPITHIGTKTIALGLVSETDFAQAVAAYKRIGILQPVETDSAHSVAAIKHVGVGLVIEADTAQAMYRPIELTPHTAAGGSLVRHLGASAISTHVNTATLIRH